MLPVNEIIKLIASHNKLSKIEMPKGKERTRPNLIKAIEDAGFKLNHEKKRIERGVKTQERKTDPKKDASKMPKKVVISKDKKPPLNTMKIKPPASKPTNMKTLRERIDGLLTTAPAQVKKFKAEGMKVKTLRELQKLKSKYRRPFQQAFTNLMDSIDEEEWWEKALDRDEDLFDTLDMNFDKKLDKGFDNAMDEIKSGLKEVVVRDIATKLNRRFTTIEGIKKYFREFKEKYMDQSSSSAVGGSLREKYADWIAENEKKLQKDLLAMGKGEAEKKPKLELKKPMPKKVVISKDKKPPLNTMKIKPKSKAKEMETQTDGGESTTYKQARELIRTMSLGGEFEGEQEKSWKIQLSLIYRQRLKINEDEYEKMLRKYISELKKFRKDNK